MGKGIVKHGFKSGVLPVAREIFKKPIKPVKLNSSIPQGYAPNIQHPKGSTRDPILPKPFPVNERIAKTAPKPSKTYSKAELEQLPEDQRYKILRSELRRQYLVGSLKFEEQRLAKEKVQAEQQSAREEEEAAKLQNMNYETETTRLTLPTIESFLRGRIMRDRTPEEQKALELKRKSNRVTQELKVKENKAVKLLDLYYESENFIIEEDELAKSIDKAFDYSDDYYATAVNDVKAKLHNFADYEQEYLENVNNQFNYVMFGSNQDSKPGIYEIEDNISGEFAKLQFEAEKKSNEKLAQEKNEIRESLLQQKDSQESSTSA